MDKDSSFISRYGIEIRGECVHAESDDLHEIFTMLAEHTGKVHVIDRAKNSLVYQGTAREVREAILLSNSDGKRT
jgi:hypothetical protein